EPADRAAWVRDGRPRSRSANRSSIPARERDSRRLSWISLALLSDAARAGRDASKLGPTSPPFRLPVLPAQLHNPTDCVSGRVSFKPIVEVRCLVTPLDLEHHPIPID